MKETHLHISISILPLIGRFNTDMMYLTLYNYFTFLFLFFRVSLYYELVNYELYLKKNYTSRRHKNSQTSDIVEKASQCRKVKRTFNFSKWKFFSTKNKFFKFLIDVFKLHIDNNCPTINQMQPKILKFIWIFAQLD